MEAYEVTQVLMTVGTVYHVRRARSPESPILFVVKGEMMASVPKFKMTEGETPNAVADMSANFIKTKYEVHDGGGALLGSVGFPTVAFKKTMTLHVGKEGDDVFQADAGVFKGVFQCKRPDGTVALEVAKELSIRDTFVVKPDEKIPLPLAFFTAVAIHSRFYDL